MLNLSVLIHTFDQYSHLWPLQRLAFAAHWEESDIPIFLGTDTTGCETVVHAGQMIYSGPGEWSDRLTALLEQIPTDYVLYMQEDHYPTRNPPDLAELANIIEKKDLFRLQISPVNQFYSLYGSEIPLFFHEKSKYLVSHQPSIWKKSFLLECLKPGENPWQNEYEGTKRLNSDPKIRGKIAIYPYDWYKHMCVKGQVQEP